MATIERVTACSWAGGGGGIRRGFHSSNIIIANFVIKKCKTQINYIIVYV